MKCLASLDMTDSFFNWESVFVSWGKFTLHLRFNFQRKFSTKYFFNWRNIAFDNCSTPLSAMNFFETAFVSLQKLQIKKNF